MKRSSFLSVLAGAALLVATAAPAFAGGAQCVWANSSDGSHPIISGVPTTFKGIVMSNRQGLRYRWKVANNTYTATTPVTDPYNLEAKYTYTGTGTKTATLEILGPTGTNFISSDTYVMTLSTNNETTKRAIAIEEGLWYLHKSLKRYVTADGRGKVLAAAGSDREYDPGVAMIGQAFIDAGFTAAGSLDSPYTENVAQIANFVTERLGIMSVGAENRPSGTMLDGYGIFFKNDTPRGDRTEYGFGTALKFIATCGYTTEKPVAFNDALNFSGDSNISISKWTFNEIAQQLVDFIGWAQLESVGGGNDYTTMDEFNTTFPPRKIGGVLAPGSDGGWPYFSEGWTFQNGFVERDRGTGSFGDVSIAYWTATGLQAAATKTTLPLDLKTRLLAFVQGHQRADGCFDFGPMTNFDLIERAGAGLYLLKYAGGTATEIDKARVCINTLWSQNNYHAYQGHPSLDAQCFATDDMGTAVDCKSHYAPGGNPLGFWICDGSNRCYWETLTTPDDINIFAFRTVTDGAVFAGINASNLSNYRVKYRDLLYRNRNAVNGAYDDHGWVNGYTFGTALAVSAQVQLTVP